MEIITPKNKSLVKIDHNKIRCSKGNALTLYRGALQGAFERKILESISRGEEPSYYGCFEEDKLTFFDSCPHVDEYIGKFMGLNEDANLNEPQFNYSKEAFESGQNPFTIHGLILKLKSEKYQDRLYHSKKGEGIIVVGDIKLKDLDIVYSKRRNLLIEEIINQQKETGIIPSEKLVNLWKKNIEKFPQKYHFLEEDVFNALQKDPDRIECICDHVFGPAFYPHPEEQKSIIRQGLQILEAKLN